MVRMDVGGKRARIGIEASANVPWSDELLALVPPALAAADAVTRRSADREVSHGSSISCAQGCDACCWYLIRLSLPEALHVRRVVDVLPEPRRTEVRARFAAAREKLADEDLLHDLETGLARRQNDPDHDHRVETLARRYLALRIPCPFLDLEERACGIYPDRPAPPLADGPPGDSQTEKRMSRFFAAPS